MKPIIPLVLCDAIASSKYCYFQNGVKCFANSCVFALQENLNSGALFSKLDVEKIKNLKLKATTLFGCSLLEQIEVSIQSFEFTPLVLWPKVTFLTGRKRKGENIINPSQKFLGKREALFNTSIFKVWVK